MYYIYNFLFYLAIPYILFRLWQKQRKLPQYEQRVWERFGFYKTPPLKECIWVHAVSYGETVAAEPLIRKLHGEYPHLPIIITNMTTAGARRVKEQLSDIATQIFVPYDLPFAVKRFLRHTHPRILILMETELWPNLLHYTRQQHIPILLANGRLSKKSLRNYCRIRSIAYDMMQNITLIASQGRTDAKRYQKLGAKPEKVHFTGNIKFDLTVPDSHLTKATEWRASINTRPIWIAASTHAGEETQILEIHRTLRESFPDLLLVLVPRHPQRFAEVYDLCVKDFKTVKRSDHLPVDNASEIFLGDTMGELFFYYKIADVAFMGGSLIPIGGHNFLECVAVNTPIIIGPDYHNFTAMVQLFNKGKGIQITQDVKDTARVLSELLSNQKQREIQAKNALRLWAINAGAVDKHVQLVHQLMKNA